MSEATTQSSGDDQSPSDLYEAGNYKEALRQYQKFAEEGVVEAQVFVGWMYDRGLGTARNAEEARRWYQRAAEAGSVDGLFYRGRLSLAEKRYADALQDFENAAKQNYSPAIYHLGCMHELGRGLPVDEMKAYAYFERAAELGHVFAHRVIAGRMMKGGYGLLRIPEGFCRFIRLLWNAARVVSKDEYDERIRT